MHAPIGSVQRFLPTACLCLALWAVFLLSSAAHAAPAKEGDTLADALAAATLDDALRQSGQAMLDEAQANAAARLEAVEASAALRAAKAAWPAKVRELEKQLAEDPRAGLAAWARRISGETDIDTLERVLTGERITLETLRGEEERLADELTGMLTAPVESAGTLISLRQELESIDEEAIGDDAPSGVIDRIRAYRNATLRQRLEAEIERASLEQDTLDQRQRLAELDLQVVRATRQTHAARLAHVQSVIVTRGDAELAALMRSLDSDVERYGAADRLDHAAVLARDTLALGRELARQSETLSSERASLPALQSARDDVENALRASTARIELGGSSEAVGRWLWSERRRLVAPARLQKRLDEIRGELADLKLREVVIAEQRRQGVQLAAHEQVEEPEGAAADGSRQVLEADLTALAVRRAEVLERLQVVLQRRATVLETMDEVIAVQHARTLELQSLLDRHLLWTRSHGAVDGEWFDRTVAGFGDLFRPGRYGKTLDLAWRNFLDQPFRWVVSLVLLGILVVLRHQAVARIEAEARVTRQIREDSYRATARALAWTVIAASPLPVAFCLTGVLLRQVGQPGNFSDSMGIGLLSMGAPFFFTQVIRFAAIERGLGHAHFRWRRARCETLRRWMPTFNWVVLPLWFVAAMSVARNLDLAADVAARIALVLASLVIAWGAWNVFAAGRLWVVRGLEVEPSWWRKATRLVCTSFPVAIGLLASAGWVHSASVLLQALLASVSAAVCIAMLVGLLSRWMLLGERRLAWRRAMEQAQPADSEGSVIPEPEGEVTLQQVNEQTGRLVRALRLALIAVAFVWVWADVLPAIGRLDEFAFWHVEDSGRSGEGALVPITAMDVFAGVFILLLTWAAARNLPGLVEIGLLSRTRIDAPTRYATTSILRYAIVITGMLLGLGMLGMHWGQLQWMAAALTVGLGFGLQEIFANFVSGLILLFERPFRVGDVITVGEYTGTVNRIRTRATTIVDFDNREIVVPNKNFITGQLTNWTLTDTVTRMTIRIGVDYGTDPALVHRLLLQAAMEVPEVMRNPEPRTWFLSFGASSLDFELRVFVASVNDRLVVQNALHTRINTLLIENGIDIAYPHLNVNLRQLPPVNG